MTVIEYTTKSQVKNLSPDTKLSDLKLAGLGPKTLSKLAQLDMINLSDLLFHFPLRYEDHTVLTPIHQWESGRLAVIYGYIQGVRRLRSGGLIAQMACFDQDSPLQLQPINICFFKGFSQIYSGFVPDQYVMCVGNLRVGEYGFEMAHPKWQLLDQLTVDQLPLETHLTPIYPSCEGLTQYSLRRIILSALQLLQTDKLKLDGFYPTYLQSRKRLFPDLKTALLYLHQPPKDCDQDLLAKRFHPAWQSILVDELLTHYCCLQQMRAQAQTLAADPVTYSKSHEKEFLNILPFQLTDTQASLSQELYQDLAKTVPMQRLLQGDVGAGKTVVAALAIVQAIASGQQAALLAPLEVLAQQHYQVFKVWLESLGVNVGLLLGKLTKKQRDQIFKELAAGSIQLIIGTHALLQEGIEFHQLGLVVVDEQHRFGIEQREKLLQLEPSLGSCKVPHLLLMTATPIPRTLAMAFYADLDVSTLNELPKGRQPIHTVAVSNHRRGEMIERVKAHCEKGEQVYWVCPLIEASNGELSDVNSIKDDLAQFLGGVRIGCLHGRMNSQEKNTILSQFKDKEIDILVSTTVIEVGVDIKNASLMVIENPERFGLAQLHQLRGRVGRGTLKSYCVLLYQAPLSENSYKRLQVIRESTDGFYIAEQDLYLRGPGDLLGVGSRQTGAVLFKYVDLMRDHYLIQYIQEAAGELDFSKRHTCDELQDAKQRWLKLKD